MLAVGLFADSPSFLFPHKTKTFAFSTRETAQVQYFFILSHLVDDAWRNRLLVLASGDIDFGVRSVCRPGLVGPKNGMPLFYGPIYMLESSAKALLAFCL